MRAVEMELPGVGEPETLRVRTRELPAPAGGEALVRVEASGVSFAEQQMRLGKHYDQPNFPFVPGYDLVGVVEQIGADAAGGRAMSASVSAWPPLAKTGGWADRVLLEARGLREAIGRDLDAVLGQPHERLLPARNASMPSR